MTEFEGSLAAPSIEALAREAGIEPSAWQWERADSGALALTHITPVNSWAEPGTLVRLYAPAAVAAIVQKAVQAEREACAQMMDKLAPPGYAGYGAAAIRARGIPKQE